MPGNLASYFSTCSYGRSRINRNDVLVLGPINMPCTGTSKGVAWTTSACEASDYYGWQVSCS